MNFTHELLIRGIKIIDIGFTVSIYIILGFISARLIDKIEGPVNHKTVQKKPFYKIVLELMLFFWFVGIFWYIARNIVRSKKPYKSLYIRTLTMNISFSKLHSC